MIPRTAIHASPDALNKLLERRRAILNVQNSLARNAESHKRMLAEGVPIEKVQEYVAGCAAAYAKWLDVGEAAGADADVQAGMALVGWTEKDFTDVIEALRPEVAALAAAPKAVKAEIDAACDALIANVDRPYNAAKSLFRADTIVEGKR